MCVQIHYQQCCSLDGKVFSDGLSTDYCTSLVDTVCVFTEQKTSVEKIFCLRTHTHTLIAVGPAVCLDESVLNFGNVACGKTSTAVVHIKNNSDVPTVFQVIRFNLPRFFLD